MKKIVSISCFGIMSILCLTCILNMNNSNENAAKITTAIEQQEPSKDNESTIIYETHNNYETHNHYEVKEEEEDEPEEIVPSDNSNNSGNLYPNLESDEEEGNTFNRATLKCEVCEQSGTELEVWFDSNNVKHYTCKDKCTNGVDALYGK